MIKYISGNLNNIKVKKKDIFFFFFISCFVVLLIIAKADLIGVISLILISYITFYFSRYFQSISIILYVALCARLIVLYLGNYYVVFPDSWGDATIFEREAWKMSQDGFFEVFEKFPLDRNSLFISWILAIFYSLTDRSIILGQSLSLLFGMGSVLLGVRLTNKIWNKKISLKVGWILALYPTLILYSCLILREAYIWFFLLIAIYGIVSWFEKRSVKAFIFIFIGFSGATFYHGGMFIGLFIFFCILVITNLIEIIKRLKYFKISINSLIFLSLSLIIIIYFVSIADWIPKIGSIGKIFDFKIILEEMFNRNINRAAFPEWTVPKSPIELIYKAPIRVLYFIFSPFIWEVKKFTHFIGFFDGIFFFVLFFFAFKNIKSIWSNRILRTILIILASYLILYGLSTGNFGTGLRHRTKFLIVFIILVAPWIPKITFYKGHKINNNKKLK